MEEIAEEMEEEGEEEFQMSPSPLSLSQRNYISEDPCGFGEASTPSPAAWSSSLATWGVYWGRE